MATPTNKVEWLPGLLGPLALKLFSAAAPKLRTIVNVEIPNFSIADDAANGQTTITLPLNSNNFANGALSVNKLAPGTNTYVLTTVGGVPVWAAPSGGGSSPTGTGVALVSGGSFVGAAGKIDLSSSTYVNNTLGVSNGGTGITSLGSGVATWMGTPSSANLAAAITDETGSGKLVFGTSPTFTTSWKLDSGGLAYTFLPSALASNVNVTVPLLVASDTLVMTDLAQTLKGKTYEAASNPATTGNYRLANTDKICTRNSANSANACVAQYDSGDNLYLGLNSAYTEQAFNTVVGASNLLYLAVASNFKIVCDANTVQCGVPVIGYSSAYSVHGQIASAHGDANYTLPAGEYKYETIKFGTACTAGRTMTFPAPASDAAAYHKEIINTTGQTLTITTGAGATKTIATGLGGWFRFTSSEGVKSASGTYTP